MAFDFENGSYTDAAGRTVLDPAVYKDWQIGAAAEQALPPVDWFRQKLGLLADGRSPIQTVRGLGYQLLDAR